MDSKESLELSVTPEELCRTCLAAVDRNQLKPIFCSEILDGKIIPFPKVIELATGEQLARNEKLPNGVCVECKRMLRDLYIFVSKVRNSKDLLYDIFKVAKPVPKAIEGGADGTTKVITKCVGVQTDASETGWMLRSTPQPVETGTQCDDVFAGGTNTPPALCVVQTSEELKSPEKKDIGIAANRECAETRNEFSLMVVKQDAMADTGDLKSDSDQQQELDQTFKGEEVAPNEDCESEFEVQLVADETSAVEESNSLRQDKMVLKLTKSSDDRSSAEEEQLDTADGIAVGLKKSTEKQQKRETCLYCNYTAKTATFAKHFFVHQQTLELCFESIEYFRCGNCFTVFMSQEHMEDHFEGSCARVQSNDIVEHGDLTKHESFYQNGLDVCVPKLKTFTGIGDGIYHCFRCPTTVDDFNAIRAHCTEHDLVDDQTDDVDQLWKTNKFNMVHICGVCGGQFSDAMFIRQHVYFHQTSYFCMYDCEQICDDFGRLTKHLQMKHLAALLAQPSGNIGTDEQRRNAAQDFSCEQCKKVLRSAVSLRMHVKNHARERKYACSICPKRFTQKGDLKTHLRTHTNERPYQCFVCDKSFRTLSQRRDHMSTHAEENKFECEVCHKKFKAARILAGHRQLHTGVRPYSCNTCSKTFFRKHHLKQHSQVHCKR